MIDAVKYPIVLTEKATVQMELNKYIFEFDLKMSKTDIKILIEDFFKCKVLEINTHRPPKKKGEAKRKRAIITTNTQLFFEN